MDQNRLVSLKIVFFLLGVFTINTSGQICSAPRYVDFPENNTIGATVARIDAEPGVNLNITDNPGEVFGLNGNVLVANVVLDYETLIGDLRVGINCEKDGFVLSIAVLVIVQNINDNPPVFEQNVYTLQVNELTAVGTPVGKIEAIDLDLDRLYYRLVSPMDEFGLQAVINPEIIVQKVLDYDNIKEVTLTLYAQDTPLLSTEIPSHTATTTVIVTIEDINNRPPWFQPCDEAIVGTTKICLMSGYTGDVNLNEQLAGALTLKPGPVRAIDGDNGRNAQIRYRFPTDHNTFSINDINGEITMKQPVGVAGTIVLTVIAYELENPDQYATTTVTLTVVLSSKHPPEFVKSQYEGFISADAGIGSLVLESKSSNVPLRVQATDADFTDGANPYLQFEVLDNNDFTITEQGFIIMTGAASPGKPILQISVVDSSNKESSTASLTIEVTPGVTTMDTPTTTNSSTTTAMTTSMAISTTISTSMTTETTSTTDITTVTDTHLTESTSSPYTVTTNPVTTPSPHTGGLPVLSGKFSTEHMVALGVSLAVVLLICFVAIGFLAFNLVRLRTDWKKLSEASIFSSSLSKGPGGPKSGVQYTNEGYEHDEDTDSVTSKQAAEMELPKVPEPSRSGPETVAMQQASPVMQSSSDNSALPTDSDSTDNDKEVKPILTKERRTEDGYKAVWFKEDINPNDKEEMVLSDRDQDIDHGDMDDDDDDDDDDIDDEDEDEDEENFAEL